MEGKSVILTTQNTKLTSNSLGPQVWGVSPWMPLISFLPHLHFHGLDPSPSQPQLVKLVLLSQAAPHPSHKPIPCCTPVDVPPSCYLRPHLSLLLLYFYLLCTHPVQAAQVLDLVLIGPGLVVNDCVLLIHTAGLQTENTHTHVALTQWLQLMSGLCARKDKMHLKSRMYLWWVSSNSYSKMMVQQLHFAGS